MPGVTRTRVGYTGGNNPSPSYGSVCGGDGHSEAIQIEFDPQAVSFESLVTAFFEKHCPGPAPEQYKSAIWVHDEEQKATVEKVLKSHNSEAARYTDVKPVLAWHDAEEYHQKYYEKLQHGNSFGGNVLGSSFWGDTL